MGRIRMPVRSVTGQLSTGQARQTERAGHIEQIPHSTGLECQSGWQAAGPSWATHKASGKLKGAASHHWDNHHAVTSQVQSS